MIRCSVSHTSLDAVQRGALNSLNAGGDPMLGPKNVQVEIRV